MEWLLKDKVRFMSHPYSTGPWNMAVDEMLSETVLTGQPVLRFYGFSPPTLSFGRFQNIRNSFNKLEAAKARIGYVRRSTGGQGVFHDNELTYSLALAKHHVRDMRKRTVYRYISGILLQGLSNLGIQAHFSLEGYGQPKNPHCFGTTGQYEIIVPSGEKIIGSAQVRGRNSCLQQGSIPLDDSFLNIERFIDDAATQNQGCISLSQVLQRRVDRAEAEAAFRKAFAAELPLKPDDLTSDEIKRAEEIWRQRYSLDEWNFSR